MIEAESEIWHKQDKAMAEMLTAKEIQDILQVDRSTVYRMAEAERLPAIKVGRQWRFPADQIQVWLDKQITTSTLPTRKTAPLAEQLPVACIQLMQDGFAEALGVMIVMADMDGNPVTEISNPCGFFSAVMPQALEKCIEQWRTMANTIDLEPKFIRSHLQLLCARAFIRVGNELKGMVFVGGIAPEDWPPTAVALPTLADDLQTTPEHLAAHSHEVYYLDENQKTNVLPFVQRIANIVSHILTERNTLMEKARI